MKKNKESHVPIDTLADAFVPTPRSNRELHNCGIKFPGYRYMGKVGFVVVVVVMISTLTTPSRREGHLMGRQRKTPVGTRH